MCVLTKNAISILLIFFFQNKLIYCQKKNIIKVDTVRWKDGSSSIDTYLNDTLIRRVGYSIDSNLLTESGGYIFGYNASYKLYYKNGKLSCEGVIINNKRDGLWVFWNEKGQRIYIKDYFDNGEKINAIYYEYYETGVLKVIKKYKGKATIIEKDPKIPDLFSVFETSENELIKTGEWIYFSEYGEVIERKKYD